MNLCEAGEHARNFEGIPIISPQGASISTLLLAIFLRKVTASFQALWGWRTHAAVLWISPAKRCDDMNAFFASVTERFKRDLVKRFDYTSEMACSIVER